MNKTIVVFKKAENEVNVKRTDKLISYEFLGDHSTSDGHHTMDELYKHRIHLFIALMKAYDNYITPLNSRNRVKCWKSKLHSDGTSYEGWFLAGMLVSPERPFDMSVSPGPDMQLSYHLPMEYWDKLPVMEYDRGLVWDGHTPNDVLERLLKL